MLFATLSGGSFLNYSTYQMLIRIPRCDALGQKPRMLRVAQVASIAVNFGGPIVSRTRRRMASPQRTFFGTGRCMASPLH